MNPRVSRSSALASKATGFPIAKIAAKLAIGYRLTNCATTSRARPWPVSSRPSTMSFSQVPRFTFEKFPGAKRRADNFDEKRGRGQGALAAHSRKPLQKACAPWKSGAPGLGDNFRAPLPSRDAILENLRVPNSAGFSQCATPCLPA